MNEELGFLTESVSACVKEALEVTSKRQKTEDYRGQLARMQLTN